MTTIDYKEKYEQALEVAQRFYNNSVAVTKKGLEDIFPELKESEDEEIKEMLKVAVERTPWMQDKKEKCYEWLEKQGEHANFRNKIQVGDKVTRNEDGVLVNLSQLKRIAKPAEEHNITGIGSKSAQGKLGEMIKNLKPVNLVLKLDSAWSEKYIADVFEKVGLAKIAREQSNDNLTNTLQDAMIELSKFIPQPNPAWSGEDEDNMMMIEDRLSDYLNYIREDTSLTKYQKNSMKEKVIGYVNWLKSLKGRVQPQPKQEWSEEDKVMLDEIIDFFENGTVKLQHDLSLYASWLKSLRPQNTWKPSEEMLEALYRAIPENVMEISEDEMLLDKLYQGLKYGRVLSEN